MVVSLKLFIWHMSREIVRMDSAGKGAAIEKSRAAMGWKGSVRERHLCTIFKLYPNFFLSAEGRVRRFDKGDCQAHFPSSLWLRPQVWFNCWVSPEFLGDLNPLKNEVKWQVGGLPSTTALCAVLRKLFSIHLSSIFLFLLKGMQWAW